MGSSNTISVKTSKSPPARSLHAKPARSVRLMQDVVRPAKLAASASTVALHPTPQTKRPQMDITPAKHLQHHQPQTAHTLMRTTVAKPQPGLKRRTHPQSPADVRAAKPVLGVTPKWSIGQIDPRRIKRATTIPKSTLIQRFAPEPSSWFNTPAHEAAALKPPVSKPISAMDTVAPRRSMDIFQRAIETATSHEQPLVNQKKLARQQAKAIKKQRPKPVHHRLPSIMTVSLAVVLLASFIAYQNRTNLTLRFADAKAGFHVSMPGYQPSGYATGPFSYNPGKVAVRYNRGSSNQTYTYAQSVSSLDSQSLLSNLIIPHSTTYQTLQNGGRTIFIYGNNNAAWVDNGFLYQITSNGSLSTSDILSIATSV